MLASSGALCHRVKSSARHIVYSIDTEKEEKEDVAMEKDDEGGFVVPHHFMSTLQGHMKGIQCTAMRRSCFGPRGGLSLLRR